MQYKKVEPRNNLIKRGVIWKAIWVRKYFKNVATIFAQNYFDLPQELIDTNYYLTLVFKIIVHISSQFIFVNMYNVVVKMIIKYVISRLKKDNENGVKMYEEYVKQRKTFIYNNVTVEDIPQEVN